MTRNYYDQASRYFAKLDPPGFLSWAARSTRIRFRRLLDTRRLPFPGEPDWICDTVAELEDLDDPDVLWAVPVEFMLEPEADLFFRLLIYLGQLGLEERPSAEPGDRYRVGALVVNLTGTGRTSRSMRLGQTNLEITLRVEERDLSQEDAAVTLAGIAAKIISPVLLAVIPLMQGGADPGIMQQWVALASAEQDLRRRGDYGGLALVFAEAAGCRPAWKKLLEGWNMVQSQQVLEWMAQGEARGEARGMALTKREDILRLLELKFQGLPPDLVSNITAVSDLALLRQWFDTAVTAASMADFRQITGL